MKKVDQKAFLLNAFMRNLQLVLSIHLIKTFSLKAVTYNCRGLLSSVHDVKALCKKYNIIRGAYQKFCTNCYIFKTNNHGIMKQSLFLDIISL